MGINENCLPLGFLNINKPKGCTSFDVVARIRKLTGIRQIGHTGTLDPFATGVLPICIGKATKLIEYLPGDKEYLATIQFGKNTDTYDIDGNVIESFDKQIKCAEILPILKSLEGNISQMPPIYSAIKVKGRKLYEYARAGESVDIQPRKITIYRNKLIEFSEEKQQAKILVACSKGTYIRSIAYDLGKRLGCGGYLSALERTCAGKFTINQSNNIENFKSAGDVKKLLISPLEVMDNTVYEMSESERNKVVHGMSLDNKNLRDTDIVFLVYGGRIYAIGVVTKEKILVKKVFEVL